MHAETLAQIDLVKSRLGGILVLLDQASAATAQGGDFNASLIAEARALASQASGYGWRGLSGLLRSLAAGLIQRTQSQPEWLDDDIAKLRRWLHIALRYLQPSTAIEAANALLPGYDTLGWTPMIAGALREYARQRLHEAPLQELLTAQALVELEAVAEVKSAVVHDAADWVPNRVGNDAVLIEAGAAAALQAQEEVCVEEMSTDALGETGFELPAHAAPLLDLTFLATPLRESEAQRDASSDAADAAVVAVDAADDPGAADNPAAVFVDAAEELNTIIAFVDSTDESETAFAFADAADDVDAPIGFSDTGSDIEPLVEATVSVELGGLAAAPAAAAEAPPAAADAPLWLSEDERSLLATAVAEQLLPLLTDLQSIESPEAQQAQVQEYVFQLALVGNAFEHCGLHEVLATINVIVADASTCEDDAVHRAIPWLNWQLAVVDWLESPQDQARQQALLDAVCDPQWPLSFQIDEIEPLRAELARLHIGTDPALKQLRKSLAQWQDVALDIAPDVLPAVLDGMLRQLPLNVAQLSASIQRLTQTGEADDIDAARRAAHALKGDANLVGLTGLAQMTHALEDILVQLARAPAPPGAALAGVLSEAGDCVETMAEYVMRQGPPPDDALDVLQSLLNWSNALLDGEVPGEPAAEVRVETLVASESVAAAPVDGERDVGEAQRTLVVAVPLLDELLRLSSETIVLTQQVAEQLRSINKDHGESAEQTRRAQLLVNELDDLVSLRGAALSSARLQGASVDPLELDQYNELHVLARRLQETNTDERAFVGNIDSALSRLEDLMAAQERMQDDLQGSVLRTRMVPVSQVLPRFQRAVRIASRNLLKELDLHVIGADTQVDSDVIETIVDPLMHALRNAADHGIEDPEQRQRLGKPSVGQLTLSFAQASGSIQISLQDDGRGLDYTAIQNKAVALGMLAGDAQPDRALLNRLILTPGFSTRSEATQMSGRGIGMDVIATRVRELKGRLRLHSEDDRGTRVEIVLPSTLVSAHVAVAWTGATPAAWVSASFNRFVAVRGDEILMGVDGWRVHRDDGEVGVIPLAALLEIELSAAIDRNVTYIAAECESAAGTVLVLADRISEMRSVIVKSTGPYMPALTGVRGAAVLGNGGIAPVIDLTELVQTTLESQHRLDFSAMLNNASIRSRHAMVIDDSLSVRRSLSTLLVDAGFEATTAIDGLDAMRLIEQRLPDVLLVDMEMPRMNGLELTSYLRSRAETQNLPVIMITSRSTERHREMAETAGVDGFLVKPYLDDEVLALVAATMAARAAAAANRA